ncbi:hypothetical protein ACFXDE_35965 [Kitasatospora sp. NPDC059408]|uniref:hypothetical protein n=1 Tax=Kitasatospora sp. NPDC059408 TaxID=3346823 RepID=UPI0036855B03
MTTTQHAAAHAVADRLHGRPAVRSFLEGPELTAADLSMVLLVREDGEDADRPMPTVTVAEIPQTVRESSGVEEDLEPLGECSVALARRCAPGAEQPRGTRRAVWNRG